MIPNLHRLAQTIYLGIDPLPLEYVNKYGGLAQ